ncbi:MULTISPECIES: sensor histidine kinase [Microbacterium]|uniref:sensor histidine kinase n=1 Tax=Microbacterium TaxID=33882 RepID=UPI00217E6A72|nr:MULTISPECIES: histidine kinase [Microbacterium]UWF77542.1 hypothetical protein JSY13_00110 [Microbacterium neungamense]WCM55711.1 hypothetical protein JRG78_00110 [Microbacterium sp. EF45047]
MHLPSRADAPHRTGVTPAPGVPSRIDAVADRAVASGRRMVAQGLRAGGSLGLYVLGIMVTACGVANVPGAAHPGAGRSIEVTDLGTGLFMLGMLAWVAVFFRRRQPAVPLAAGAVLALVGMEYLLLLLGAASALLRWPVKARRMATGAAAALVLVFVLREMFTPWGDADILLTSVARSAGEPPSFVLGAALTIGIAALSVGAAFGLAILVRTRRESLALRNRVSVEHDRAESLTAEVGRQAERERLARDIHDALAHRLSVISLQSGALEEAARSQDQAVAQAAQTLRHQAHASLEDLRGLLGELRREPGTAADTDAAVPPSMASMRTIGHLIRTVRQSGAAVDAFVLIDDAEHAGAALDRTVYRIVQECLTNALKHAPGSPVSVYVEAAPSSGVRIRVSNPLPGAAGSGVAGAGRGLNGIRERTELLGGTAWIGETQGEFLVDVTLPWPPRT